MCAAIENPAKCEVRGVIRFLWAKKLSAADIHRELRAVYGPNIMSEGVVRQWNFIKEIDEKFVCSVISQSPNFQNTFQTFLGQFCKRQ
ncbi:HTH_48 domain-containing protein [Trichonephila clavipes]|uniref:HTH_48 domain-containing protein n=1 Tax=Trichonephila clavipes TaxID=2585209 RepID=A0A8X6T0F1_TRICX|nr:HTH_48 domain-containing protein [Trichonephila clavipes]